MKYPLGYEILQSNMMATINNCHNAMQGVAIHENKVFNSRTKGAIHDGSAVYSPRPVIPTKIATQPRGAYLPRILACPY